MSWKEEIKKFGMESKLKQMLEILDSDMHSDDKVAKLKGYITSILKTDF